MFKKTLTAVALVATVLAASSPVGAQMPSGIDIYPIPNVTSEWACGKIVFTNDVARNAAQAKCIMRALIFQGIEKRLSIWLMHGNKLAYLETEFEWAIDRIQGITDGGEHKDYSNPGDGTLIYNIYANQLLEEGHIELLKEWLKNKDRILATDVPRSLR